MKPSGLIRILLTSVFALLVAGGMMTAQAQETVIVDQDGGEDELSIQNGLTTLNTEVGNNANTSTGILVVIAGDYTSDGNIQVGSNGATGNIENLIVEVRRDQSSNTDELTLESLDLAGGATVTDVTLRSSNGSEFVQIQNAGANANDLDLAEGTLLIESNTDLRVQGGSQVRRAADANVDGSGIAPDYQGSVNLVLNVAAGDLTAGLETPPSLNGGNLTVDDGGNGNEVTFPNDIQVNAFNYTGGDVEAQGNFSVASNFTVTGGAPVDDFVVNGTLTFRQNNPTLDVDGTADINALNVDDFTSGAVAPVLRGDGELSVGTFTIVGLDDDGADDAFEAQILADASSSSFTVGNVTTPESSDNDETDVVNVDVTNTNGGAIRVGGTLNDVNNNSQGATLTLTGGTIDGSLDNSNATGNGGTVTVASNVTYNFAAAGSAVNNAGTGQIAIAPGATLTIDDSGDGNQGPVNVLTNNGQQGVTGSGTLMLAGDGGDSFTVTTNAGEDNILPNVTANAAVTLDNDDAAAPAGTDILLGSLTANADVTLDNSGGGLADLTGTLTANNGTVDATAGQTDVLNVDLNDGGEIDISGQRMNVKKNFTREGTPNALLTTNGGSTLGFTSSQNGNFDTGSIFTVNGELEVDKPNFQLTLQEAVRVNGDVTVVDPASQFINTTLVLKDNLIMSGGGAGTFTLNSKLDTRQDAQGDSTFVLFEDAGDTVAGTDTLDNVVVQTPGGDINVAGATTLEFRGQLELRSGGISVPGGSDLSPVGSARVVRWINSAGTSISGSFNGSGNLYNLTYTKAGNNPTGSELTDDVRNLKVDAGAQPQLDDDYDVNGMLTVNGTIGDDGSARILSLVADSLSHSIVGTVGDANVVTLQVAGNGVTINGSTNDNNASSVQDVIVDGSGATISNVQRITGNLTLNQGGTLALGLSDAAGQGVNDATIAGNVTVSDSLSLDSNVSVTSADGADDVKVTGTGQVNFGSSNLIVRGNNADFDGDGGAAYHSSGGDLIFAGANTPTFGTAGEAVPRVRVDQAINLSENVATSEFLDVDANILLAGNDFEFMGDVELAANVTGAGTFRALATTITAEGNQSISNLEVATGDDSLKVLTDDPATPAPRTLTITNQLTLDGTLYHSINEVEVTGATVSFTSGEVASTSGFFDLNTTGNAIAVTPTAGVTDTLNVTNLSVSSTNNDASFGGDGLDLGIRNALTLGGQFDASTGDGQILIYDGVQITRTTASAVLAESLVFWGMYDLEYDINANNNVASGFELDDGESTLRNLTVDHDGSVQTPDANNVTFAQVNNGPQGDVVVNGTLHADDGDIMYPNRQLRLADGATFRQTTNLGIVGGQQTPPLVADGMYTLQYDSANLTTSGKEFLGGGIVNLQIGMVTPAGRTTGTATLHANRTVKTLTVDANSDTGANTGGAGKDDGLDLATNTLTVDSLSTVNSATVGNGVIAANGDFVVNGGTIQDPDVDFSFGANNPVDQTMVQASADVIFNGGAFGQNTALAYVGQATQNLELASNSGLTQLILDQSSGNRRPRVMLSGGNLTVNGLVTFDNGLFVTGDNRLVLAGGFTRNVDQGEASHVVGTVRQGIPNGFTGRLEYPVGTDTSATLQRPRYRPYALTFDQTDPAITATNVDVEHVNKSPRGTVGLPLNGGPDVTIGNYPDFYWLVDATTSLGSQQRFDIELQGDNLGLPFEDEEDLRIIRRFDGNAEVNQWKLQGDPADYDNILTVDEGDSTVVVRDIGSQGGIVTQAARMTIGVPSRAAAITAGPAPGDTLTVLEDSTLTATFQAEGRDIGSEIEFSLENAPDNASIQEVNGLAATLNAAQSGVNGGFDSGTSPGSGSASFTVNQNNGTITSIDYEISITGLDFSGFVDDAPGTADADDDVVGFHIHNAAREQQGGIAFGIVGSQSDALNPDTTNDADRTISVESGNEVVISGSWDADEGTSPDDFADAILNAENGEDVPLYLNVHTTGNQGGEIRGQLRGQETALFTFTPDFEQAGFYDITVVVTDVTNNLTTTRDFTVEVLDNTPPFMIGDPSQDSTVTAGDASLVLQFAVGSIDFSLSQRNAADVSGDGNINAADASLILQFVAGLIDSFPAEGSNAVAAAKSRTSTMATVDGRIGWGELASGQKDGTMTLPLLLKDAENVRSVQMTAEFDPSTMSVSDVTSALPSGWQMIYKVDREAGTIRIAMAGAEPVAAGEIANLVISTKGDAGADVSGRFALNTAEQQSIAATTVRALPDDFALKSNYPNPFQQATTIEYALPEETKVTLEVYNVLGQRVATLVNEKQTAGQHTVTFDASQLSSGMYIYRIQAGSFTKSNRMTIVK